MGADAAPQSEKPLANRPWLAFAEIALIFVVFFVHAGAPVPEVNEAHYLGKAKHYWDPTWCDRDFFLRSADAHQFFYWTFGWVTRVAPLPTVAWIGRIVVWLFLAWSWRRLSVAIAPGPFYSVLSAALMVLLTSRDNMAGEWIVGGVEAKGFAFGFVFLALEALALGRWNRTWILLGLASAFHVLVGGWAMVAVGIAWLLSRGDRPRLRSMVGALTLGFLLSLPGLIPVLTLNRGVDAATAAEATRIYVFERLAHHLVFYQFKPDHLIRFAVLAVAWMILSRYGADKPRRRIDRFVWGTVAIAVVGMALTTITWSDPLLAAKALRYYWFRAVDVMVPIGVALWIVSRIASGRALKRRWTNGLLIAAMAAGAWHLTEMTTSHLALARQPGSAAPAELYISQRADWQAICKWIAESNEIPADALFITPYDSYTFRWRAGRAEVVNRKDLPQDAQGVIEWWNRLQDIHRAGNHRKPSPWHASLVELGAARLKQLGVKHGAEYAIAPAEPPLDLVRVGPPNASYAVYRLVDDAGPTEASGGQVGK